MTEDVLAHQRVHQVFPHDPTADQFFTETRFESYRALGSHAVGRALSELLGQKERPSIDDLVNLIEGLNRQLKSPAMSAAKCNLLR